MAVQQYSGTDAHSSLVSIYVATLYGVPPGVQEVQLYHIGRVWGLDRLWEWARQLHWLKFKVGSLGALGLHLVCMGASWCLNFRVQSFIRLCFDLVGRTDVCFAFMSKGCISNLELFEPFSTVIQICLNFRFSQNGIEHTGASHTGASSTSQSALG